ncbi:tetratricopeptide repeat protein [Enterocloster aldenensis]|uniref:tetratricopeptide repeat protein n=1 Tax=Enterocloster aldenensis TaxID=358742 RepID=UPI0040287D10
MYHIHGFYGRTKEIKVLYDIFKNKNDKIVLVHGPAGIGKTELCKEIANKLNIVKWNISFVDCQGKNGLEGLLISIMATLQLEQAGSAEDVIRSYFKSTGNKNTLIIFDNFEDILFELSTSIKSKVLTFIVSLAQIDLIKILISSRTIITGMVYSYKINSLDLDSAKELFLNIWNGNDELFNNVEQYDAMIGFLQNDLQLHPLSIVLAASQGYFVDDIFVLISIWKRNYPLIEIDIFENPNHKNLLSTVKSTFDIIKSDIVCLEVWGIISLCPVSITLDFIEMLLDEDINTIFASIKKMNLLNLVLLDDNRIGMLKSLKGLVFHYLDVTQHGSFNNSINILFKGYLKIIRVAKEKTPYDYNLIQENIDNIVYFIDVLLDTQNKSFIEQIHMEFLHFYQFRTLSAVSLFEVLISKGELIGIDEVVMARTYRLLGDFQVRIGNLNDAKSNILKAKCIFEAKRDVNNIANTSRSLGIIYHRLCDFELAQKNYKEAVKLYRSTENTIGLAHSLTVYANILVKYYETQKAESLLREAVNLFKSKNDIVGLAYAYSNIGDLYNITNNQDCYGYYVKAEELNCSVQYKLGLAQVFRSIGDFKIITGNIDVANENYIKALEIFKSEQDGLGVAHTELSRALRFQLIGEMNKFYDSLNNSKNAFKAEKDYIAVNYVDLMIFKYEVLIKNGSMINLSSVMKNFKDLKHNVYYYFCKTISSNYIFKHLDTRQAFKCLEEAKSGLKNHTYSIIYYYTTYYELQYNIILGKNTIKKQDINHLLDLFKKNNNKNGISNTIKLTADYYALIHAFEKSVYLYTKAKTIYEEIGDELGKANCLKNIGLVYLESGRNEMAEIYLNDALIYYKSIFHIHGMINTSCSILLLSSSNKEIKNNALKILQENKKKFLPIQKIIYRNIMDGSLIPYDDFKLKIYTQMDNLFLKNLLFFDDINEVYSSLVSI